MADSGRHLRPRDGTEQPTTPVELLFDLVYVIAVTQLSHLVIGHRESLDSVAQASFLLLVVWWAWIYTTWMVNWFDPASGAVRLVLLLCGLASLIMSVALPRAFARSRAPVRCGLRLAAGGTKYSPVRHPCWIAHTGCAPTFERIVAWSVGSGALWLLGGLAGAGDRMVVVGPGAGGRSDRSGGRVLAARPWARAGTEEWSIDGGHFAERFQAFIIIALGESIGVTGLTALAGSSLPR